MRVQLHRKEKSLTLPRSDSPISANPNPLSLFWRFGVLAVNSPSGAGVQDETPKAVTVANGIVTIKNLAERDGHGTDTGTFTGEDF